MCSYVWFARVGIVNEYNRSHHQMNRIVEIFRSSIVLLMSKYIINLKKTKVMSSDDECASIDQTYTEKRAEKQYI